MLWHSWHIFSLIIPVNKPLRQIRLQRHTTNVKTQREHTWTLSGYMPMPSAEYGLKRSPSAGLLSGSLSPGNGFRVRPVFLELRRSVSSAEVSRKQQLLINQPAVQCAGSRGVFVTGFCPGFAPLVRETSCGSAPKLFLSWRQRGNSSPPRTRSWFIPDFMLILAHFYYFISSTIEQPSL